MKDYTFFYTVKPIYKTVNKEECIKFIQNYPRPLEYDAFGAYEPPLITYNDFELANRWPHSIVVEHIAYDDNPSSYYYKPVEEQKFEIMINYEEVFASKTGNMVGDNDDEM